MNGDMTSRPGCLCNGTGTVTAAVSLADAVLLTDRACPSGCQPPTQLTSDPMSAYLDAEERRQMTLGGGNVECGYCHDFRTDVTDGVEHPCRHCQSDLYEAWAAEVGAGVS